MRSQVIQSVNMEAEVKSYSWKAKPDYQAADGQLYQAALKYKHYETVTQVANGDIATVNMQSQAKKFNRKLKLQVGGNLFDRELEAALIGNQAGREYTVSHSAGQITYTVESIQRLVVPTLTDEMAQALQLDGVSTAVQLRGYYVQESLEKQLRNEVYDFVPMLLEKWEFSIDEQDLFEMDEHEMERCRSISRSMGKVFDDMTEQELQGAVGCRNIPEFRAMIHEYHAKTLRATLAEAFLSGKDAMVLTPDDANVYYGALMERIVHCALHQMKENAIC